MTRTQRLGGPAIRLGHLLHRLRAPLSIGAFVGGTGFGALAATGPPHAAGAAVLAVILAGLVAAGKHASP